MVGGQGKEESSAADAPHLHYDLATATAEHEHGSDESRSAGHRRSSDGREQGRVIGRAHGPLGKTLACPLTVINPRMDVKYRFRRSLPAARKARSSMPMH